jgi:hypothetical protein
LQRRNQMLRVVVVFHLQNDLRVATSTGEIGVQTSFNSPS